MSQIESTLSVTASPFKSLTQEPSFTTNDETATSSTIEETQLSVSSLGPTSSTTSTLTDTAPTSLSTTAAALPKAADEAAPVGAIVGGTMGGVAALTALFCLLLFLRRGSPRRASNLSELNLVRTEKSIRTNESREDDDGMFRLLPPLRFSSSSAQEWFGPPPGTTFEAEQQGVVGSPGSGREIEFYGLDLNSYPYQTYSNPSEYQSSTAPYHGEESDGRKDNHASAAQSSGGAYGGQCDAGQRSHADWSGSATGLL
ncbi:hypothetical protein D9615_002031 [Tricholomella constricta]|uniref:Uncharacterized protein n=1 Tax=Tricholomella constricta TaxID=117010 RepID=A0A8H5MAM8_9AGAR|nr:hypothetical protein D9615_002031 [Tricholomella constricta]